VSCRGGGPLTPYVFAVVFGVHAGVADPDTQLEERLVDAGP